VSSAPLTTPPPHEGPIARVLAALPRRLAEERLEHAFLRGVDGDPARATGADVDLLVEPAAIERAVAVLEALCAEHGAGVYGRARFPHLVQLHAYGVDELDRHGFLSFDLHAAEACRGVPFLTARQLLARVEVREGIARLHPADSALVDFLGPFLAGRVRPDYLERLSSLAGADVEARLRELFGPSGAAELLAGLRAHDPAALEHAAPRLRRRLLARRCARSPLPSLAGGLACWWEVRVAPWWRPRGRFLAFLGTDGAGKSTLVEAVGERLSNAFRSHESGVFHLRPGLLPQLDRVVHLGRATQGPADWSRPHRATPSGRLVSNLRVLWYALDYVLGYALRILPRRRRNSLIVFDRYFYDYLVDPERCRVRHATLLAAWLARLVPRPDDVIVVTAPLEVVQARKRELPPAESERQLAAYEALAARDPRFHVVDNAGSVEEGVRRVLLALFPPRPVADRRAA